MSITKDGKTYIDPENITDEEMEILTNFAEKIDPLVRIAKFYVPHYEKVFASPHDSKHVCHCLLTHLAGGGSIEEWESLIAILTNAPRFNAQA